MANRFTSVWKNLWNSSNTQRVSLISEQPTNFNAFSSFFSWLTGNRDAGRYTKAYGDNPLVYMVVHKIAETSADMNRVAVDENGEPIENSRILELLNNPNPDQGRKEFLEEAGEYLSTTGNNFIRYIQGIGAGEEIRNLIVKNLEIVCDNSGEVSYYDYTNIMGNIERIPTDEILHIHTSNIVNVERTQVKYGLSPLQAAWIIVQSSSEKLNAEASIFKNRGIIGILTNSTDVPMLKTERERLQSEFDSEVGGSDKYNKIKISNTKLDYIQTGMSPTDLKLLEGIISSLRLICSIYGMPSVLFNDNERSTFNNISEAKKTAYTDVYLPLANKIDEKLSRFLSEKLGVQEFIIVDLTSIEVLRASTNELAQALNSLSPLVANKVLEGLTWNEVREIVDAGNLADGGDERSGAAGTQPTVTTDG